MRHRVVESSHSLTRESLPAERTYLPLRVKATEETGAPSCAAGNVATHWLDTPSQILMLPSTEADT